MGFIATILNGCMAPMPCHRCCRHAQALEGNPYCKLAPYACAITRKHTDVHEPRYLFQQVCENTFAQVFGRCCRCFFDHSSFRAGALPMVFPRESRDDLSFGWYLVIFLWSLMDGLIFYGTKFQRPRPVQVLYAVLRKGHRFDQSRQASISEFRGILLLRV